MNEELKSVSNRKVNLVKRSQKEKSFLPTIMTRLSPFFPVNNHQIGGEIITEPIVFKNQWGKIIVTGKQLSIFDETVLLSLLMLLKRHDNNAFETTPDEICELVGVKRGNSTSDAIISSIQRMSQTHIIIEKRVYGFRGTQKQIEGTLITGFTEDNTSGKILLELNLYFLSSFRDGLIKCLDIRLRSELRGDISKALYRFYEGQRLNCNTISIMKLSRAINVCCDGSMYSLRMKLRKAMRELETEGYLRRFILPRRGEVVAIFKSSNRFLNNYIWAFNDGKIERKVIGI